MMLMFIIMNLACIMILVSLLRQEYFLHYYESEYFSQLLTLTDRFK